MNAVPATPRTTVELQGMRWILQPPLVSQIRNPQVVRTTTLLDGSISLAFTGYQSTENPRLSRVNKKDIEDINEEEFVAPCFFDYPEIWDTLGEPSGRIPQGLPGGTWYEFYRTGSEQNDDQQNSDTNWVSETSQLTTDIANLNIQQNTEAAEGQEAAHVHTEQIVEQLEYPIFRKLVQSLSKEKAFTSTSDSAISNYRQPNEPLMGQINYPPAQGTTPQFIDNGPYKGKFKGKALDHQAWTLPSAQQTTGAMLVLPEDIGDKECGWRSQVYVGDTMKNCPHKWEENKTVSETKMTACPSCPKYYLGKAIPYKETQLIPPYQKQEKIIRELLDYTQHLQSSIIKQKGKTIMIEDNDDEDHTSDKEFVPFLPGKEEVTKVTFEFLKIRRLTETAKIPERQTWGAVGYNLFLDEAIQIPARDRRLVKTGISLEFSEGHYARVAARSGASVRLKLDVGVGVIDADYLGEIQILLINNSDSMISLKAGDSVAQSILEKIITPQIEEVATLTPTQRNTGAFGSTNDNSNEKESFSTYKLTIYFVTCRRYVIAASLPRRVAASPPRRLAASLPRRLDPISVADASR
ncbi:hypothetical protein ZIOFF_024103 [Zingiber officinale]|uniref:dUTP diphosphatase n=1 Tax=Zingiber officinale TaxID=94328 RepID=A0A8J5LDA3_ZINOF|nr:hypothetical protein ZIOFF_024103 [Zingiber officinale]